MFALTSATAHVQTLSMLECFEDMLSGKLSSTSSPASSDPIGRSSVDMVYLVPPSEFLKVLLEGNTTRLGALHAVLQVQCCGLCIVAGIAYDIYCNLRVFRVLDSSGDREQVTFHIRFLSARF